MLTTAQNPSLRERALGATPRTLAVRLLEGPLDVREALVLGVALFESLDALHRAGATHLALEPGNMSIDPSGPITTVTLSESGHRRRPPTKGAPDSDLTRAVAYGSPEQNGLVARGVDARADLYTAGAVLYASLAGHPPVLGAHLGEVLRHQATQPVSPLRGLGVPVPRALDELLQRLLRLDPDERYQSAASALVDLRAIRGAYEGGDAEPAFVIGCHDERKRLIEPAFVGRTAELGQLVAALIDAEQGRGTLVLVEAPSGGGKSRVCDELRLAALARRAWVVNAQTTVSEAELPFQLFASVAGAVAEALAGADTRASELVTRLRQSLGDRLPLVCQLFPELARVLPTEEVGSAVHENAPTPQAALDAMVLVLDALGDSTRPILLILDDVQWAPELLVQWLLAWQRHTRTSSRAHHALVVAALRGDEIGAEHPLRQPGAVSKRVLLTPLTREEIHALAESMAGRLSAHALEPIARLSAGNPFQAASILEGMVESGALVVAEGGWRAVPAALDELSSSREAAAILSRRLDRFPDATVELLTAGALLGRRFDPVMAAELAHLDPGDAAALLEAALERHILWREPGGACVFTHDRLRAELLARTPVDRRRTLHRDLAVRLEASDASRVFDLAHHFDAAGDAPKALKYALAAAPIASIRGDSEIAERYLLIADRAAAEADAPVRARIAEALGDVQMLRGRYQEAARRLDAARTLLSGPLAQARISYKEGDLGYRAGNFAASTSALERGLVMLGRRVPKHLVLVVASILFQLFVQLLHSLMPRLFVGRRTLADADEDLLVCSLYSRLTLTAFLNQGMLHSLRAHLCELNLAERYQATPALALAYANHGVALGQFPWFGRAVRYAERAVDIARVDGSPLTLGKALHHLSFVLSWCGRFDEALARQRESLALLRRHGDRWELETCMFGMASTLYRKGELEESIEVCKALQAYGLEDGNPLAATYPLEIWAKASDGRIAASESARELERAERHPEIKPAALQAEALRLLGERRWREARARLDQAAAFARRLGLRSEFVAPIPCWQATVLRRELEEAPALAGSMRRQLLRQAHRATRRALSVARRFRNNLPHAYRERGLVLALAGHARRATQWLQRSLGVAQAQGARHEQTLTLAAQRNLERAQGWSGRSDGPRAGSVSAREGERRIPVATPSLIDRFETVLYVGRRITLALTPKVVYESALDAAIKLLRAEHGLILEAGPAPDAGGARKVLCSRGTMQAEHLGGLVEQALAAGEAVTENRVARTVLPGAPGSEIRCALCVPIKLRGDPVATLYVASSRVTGLFDGEGSRLADFIATLAGAALENAEGFGQVLAGEIALRESEQKIRSLTEAAARRHEDERRRLALALHDGAGQVLLAASLKLRELERRLPPEDTERAGQVQRLLRGVLADIRGLSHDLYPSTLDDLGLVPALRDLAESMTAVALSIEVLAEGEEHLPRLSSDVSLGLYRIAQAAVTNVVAHARARHAQIHLKLTSDEVSLEISDDGAGFELAAPRARSGIGLVGIEERAVWLGGRCQITSTPGQGTRVCIVAPLPQRT